MLNAGGYDTLICVPTTTNALQVARAAACSASWLHLSSRSVHSSVHADSVSTGATIRLQVQAKPWQAGLQCACQSLIMQGRPCSTVCMARRSDPGFPRPADCSVCPQPPKVHQGSAHGIHRRDPQGGMLTCRAAPQSGFRDPAEPRAADRGMSRAGKAARGGHGPSLSSEGTFFPDSSRDGWEPESAPSGMPRIVVSP